MSIPKCKPVYTFIKIIVLTMILTPEESYIYRKESIMRFPTPERVAYNDQQSAMLYATRACVCFTIRYIVL